MLRLGTPDTGDPSDATPGLVIADILNPRPTSCTVLEDGDIAVPGLAFPGKVRSADQYLTRWTELSKLLQARINQHSGRDL